MDATSRECNTTFATQLARCNDQRTSLHAQLLCKIFLSEGQHCSATMVAESHEVSCQPLLNRMEEVAGSEPLSDKGMHGSRSERGIPECLVGGKGSLDESERNSGDFAGDRHRDIAAVVSGAH